MDQYVPPAMWWAGLPAGSRGLGDASPAVFLVASNRLGPSPAMTSRVSESTELVVAIPRRTMNGCTSLC